eukprot:3253513-Alexandrium_andersonii.AAC.1
MNAAQDRGITSEPVSMGGDANSVSAKEGYEADLKGEMSEVKAELALNEAPEANDEKIVVRATADP